jgi:hypothetical protein
MKDSRLSQGISIALLGLLISVIAFIILGYAEGLYHNLNQIRWLPLIDVENENISLADGMAKIKGQPEAMALLKAEGSDDNLLYYKKVYEEKINDKWTEVRIDESVLDFKISGYLISPKPALKFFDLQEISVNETDNTRQTIYGVSTKDNLIVVGAIKDGQIKGGEIFAVSNKTNDVLEKELNNLIHDDWWILRLIAWGLLTFGIISFFLPIMQLLEILPELGPIVILIQIGCSVALGFLIVVIETLIFAYWYLIIIILLFVVYLLFRILCCKKGRAKMLNFIPK